jgi:hypothetical protein
MRNLAAVRVATLAVALCCMAMGPVASASASSRSIKLVIRGYNGRVEVAEGHVETTAGDYEQSSDPKDPAPVEAAIGESIAVLGALKAKVALQSANAPRVKRAKAKIEKGIGEVIVGYGYLSSAFAEKATDPQAATAEAKKSVALAEEGRRNLLAGVKLLG